jgi:hypothetical protein
VELMMASFTFEISYAAPALPGWEASRTLRSITHIYYYGLIARNANHSETLNRVFKENGGLIPEDLSKQLRIPRRDQLFLEVRSLSPQLAGTGSSENNEETIHSSNAIQAIKKLRERLRREREAKEAAASGEMTDGAKREEIVRDQEIQETLLNVIEKSELNTDLKSIIRNLAIAACQSLLADIIERFEFTFPTQTSR